ncbi:ATP-binding protein [Acinetobacter baumannii]|uniref:ATP-binding protein n=1 Tax=Acinetobacter baumannii TaxID=470 RepID=UPI00234CDCA8|nr:ATP-binding protein [Acinetobacter baumannii]MDC7429296.1 ATP-binding protein [Acinetobacter baumannii]MDC7466701.1 ATP-binding protein [Acinetobacter baumannii]
MHPLKIQAVYQDTGVPAYKGNPFIEALPPLLEAYTQTRHLRSGSDPSFQDLNAPRVVRSHSIARLSDDFFQPLNNHILLTERISLMIRGGYVGRNPRTGDLQKHLQNGYERIQKGDLKAFRFESVKSTAQSMVLIGCSGYGKTTSLNRILSNYPQVIYHPDLNIEQVVYLKIDCSHNGSLKEICLNFFRALDQVLDTHYEKQYGLKRYNIQALLTKMSQLANAHALGLLAIDEIQHLSRSKSGGSQEMLNFFVTMVNTIGVPIMLIGTPKAREIFEADFRSARRGAGFGAIFWEPLPEYIDNQLNPEWIAFTDKLWKQQLLNQRDEYLSDDIRHVWYGLSQGIIDIVVKLFVLAQLRAIATNKERITSKLLQQVYDEELKPVHPMLDALRSGNIEKISRYSDLVIPDMDRRVFDLQQKIKSMPVDIKSDDIFKQLITEDERRIYTMFKDEYEPQRLIECIKTAYQEQPIASRQEIIPIVFHLLSTDIQLSNDIKVKLKPKKIEYLKQNQWDILSQDDLRFLHSQYLEAYDLHQALQILDIIINLDNLVSMAG